MRSIFLIISFGLSLVLFCGTAAAQEGDASLAAEPGGDATTIGPGSASAVPGNITRGSSGMSLLSPDGTYAVSDTPPSSVTVGGMTELVMAPEPEPEPVVDTTTESVDTTESEPVIADTTATETTDLDGDNYPDDDEPALGLDPTSIDTDADGVADGDELNIYSTDPTLADTDGDGVSDGDELYNLRTDPLVWNDESTATADGGSAPAMGSDAAVTDETATAVTPGDSDGDRLADTDEAAAGTDPANPDSDGDGYYDGDEAKLSVDPLDPSSYPVA